MEENNSIWRVSILRSNNLHLLHRKSTNTWKPLVCVSVDHHLGQNHCAIHERPLGKDGQNPNSKDWLELSNPHARTRLLFEVIHTPQASKKKARRQNRTVLGSCVYEMGELVKMAREQGHTSKQCHITLCLTPSGAVTRTKRSQRARKDSSSSSASEKSPYKTGPTGPSLHVKLVPPKDSPLTLAGEVGGPGLPTCDEEEEEEEEGWVGSDQGDDAESSSTSSQTLNDEGTTLPPTQPPSAESTLRRRRRVRRPVPKGYACNSDDEVPEEWESVSETDTGSEQGEEEEPSFFDDSVVISVEEESGEEQKDSSWSPWPWVDHVAPILGMFGMSQPGILPSYSDLDEGNKNAMVEFQSEGNGWEIEWEWWERILCKFTVYKELRIAETEQYISARRSSTSPESVLPPGDDAKFRTLRYERVHQQLQTEWNYVGVLLVALAGVDAATFAISPSSADSEIKTTSEAFSDTMLSESLFPINALARSAVSMSIIATALGLLFVTWFLLYYGWVDFETFFNRAHPSSSFSTPSSSPYSSRITSYSDVVSSSASTPSFSSSSSSQPPRSPPQSQTQTHPQSTQSWGYFALSARIPALCMLLSVLFIVLFLLIVARDAAPPAGLWFLGVLVGMGMWMQYVVRLARVFGRGVRCLVLGVGSVGSRVWAGVSGGLGRLVRVGGGGGAAASGGEGAAVAAAGGSGGDKRDISEVEASAGANGRGAGRGRSESRGNHGVTKPIPAKTKIRA